MNTSISSLNWNALFASAVGIATTGMVVAYIAGWKMPLITNDRAAFFAVASLGFVMCMLGMGKVISGLGWAHPITIIGSVIGTLILLLSIAVLAGWRFSFLPDDHTALVVVLVLGLVKWGLGIFSHLFLNA